MSFDLEWLYDIFYLEAWHLFSIVLGTSFFCYICLQARKTVLVYHYLALQGIILIWLACKVFKTLAPTPELKWIFIVAQYLAVCFVGSALLLFGYVYARGKPLSRQPSFLWLWPPTPSTIFFTLPIIFWGIPLARFFTFIRQSPTLIWLWGSFAARSASEKSKAGKISKPGF